MTIANVTPIPTTLGSKYSVDTTTFQYPRRAVLIGDSITARGNYSVTLTTLTVDESGLGTFTGTAHALYPGAPFALMNASIDGFNGYNTVIDRTSSSVFTARLQKGLAGAATGATMGVTALGRFSDRNWFEMANSALASHPFNTVLNMGASGQTTTEIRARFARDALAFAPDLIQIQGGINDIQATAAGAEAATLATLKSNFTYMIEATLASGAVPLVVTCLPLSSTASSYTAARGQLVLKFNQWLRQLAAYTYSKMVLFDFWAVCADPASATGNYLTNYSATDGIHPSPLACQKGSQTLTTLLGNFYYPSTNWVGSLFDSYDNDSSNKQIDPNPLNTGTGGTAAGGATGNVPNSYTATKTGAGATAAMTIVAAANGIGNDMICTFTSTADADAIDIVQTSQLHARTSPGDVIVAQAHVNVTGITNMSNLSYAFEWVCTETGGGAVYTQPAAIGTSGTTASVGAPGADNIDYILRTPPLTATAGGLTGLKTRLKMTFNGAGGAVLKYGQHSITILQAAPSIVPPATTTILS